MEDHFQAKHTCRAYAFDFGSTLQVLTQEVSFFKGPME